MNAQNQNVHYECDPDKNSSCKKRMCYKSERAREKYKDLCRITFNEEFAKLDEKGEPIIYAQSERSKMASQND